MICKGKEILGDFRILPKFFPSTRNFARQLLIIPVFRENTQKPKSNMGHEAYALFLYFTNTSNI